MLRRIRKEGPITAESMLVKHQCVCPFCNSLLDVNHYFQFVPWQPASELDRLLMEAGNPDFEMEWMPVHFDCLLRRLIRAYCWPNWRGDRYRHCEQYRGRGFA